MVFVELRKNLKCVNKMCVVAKYTGLEKYGNKKNKIALLNIYVFFI